MLIVEAPINVAIKLTGFELANDGSMWVTVRRGAYAAGVFTAFGETQKLHVSVTDTAVIMSATPDNTLNRRDDLSNALYQYLIAKGYSTGSIV